MYLLGVSLLVLSLSSLFLFFQKFGVNQSKPEFTVDLKGALIDWASKDKSSKKNVIEVNYVIYMQNYLCPSLSLSLFIICLKTFKLSTFLPAEM